MDPDDTVPVTETKNQPDGFLLSFQNWDLHEEGTQEEGEEEHGDLVGDLSSPAPNIHEEDRTAPNRTGNMHYFNLTRSSLWTLVQARGPKHADASDIIIIEAAQMSSPQIVRISFIVCGQVCRS